ncbi:MAG: LCP family protein, partial [Clostridia bacterium]|nr:LCP family protein [Clostridia bacterium]
MKLFKTCLAAAIACSLFYSLPVNKIQEATTEVIDVPCVQASPQELLSDGYSPPDTLQKMLSPEYKNTLILCTDGSEMLYDSIFIIGHNKAANSVKVISLPRDLYVPYGEEIRQQLVTHNLVQEKGIFKLNIAGFIGQKINYPSTCFEDGDISFMADTIQAMTGVVVSNYAIFNFKTFEQLVDTVGGITLNIPMDIRDGNGTLLLPKGTQT